jgi:hypothetical protein
VYAEDPEVVTCFLGAALTRQLTRLYLHLVPIEPADLRWLLDTFLMSQQGAWEEYETPRFFLLQNGQVTASTAGNNGWRDFMWPTILDVTNTKP